MKVTLEWPIELPDGTEVLYDIECDVTPYDPGVCFGPPERCYPPEGGEVEILKIELQGLDGKPLIEVPHLLWRSIGLNEKVIGRIEEAAAEKACDLSVDDDPPDPRED